MHFFFLIWQNNNLVIAGDVIKCLDVCKNFVQYSEKYTEINEIKIEAYLRLMVALIMYYTQFRATRNPLEG